jgi:hypothetical protein
MLEEKPEQVDRDERSLLFLGKSRMDKNVDRLALLAGIETNLADYGIFYENRGTSMYSC